MSELSPYSVSDAQELAASIERQGDVLDGALKCRPLPTVAAIS